MSLDALAKEGGTFVLVPSRSKNPGRKGWQSNPRSIEEATQHLAGGGNVGLLCGTHSNGLILLDLDANAEDFADRFPHLTNWIAWRDNARDRAKYVVRLDGRLRSRKSIGFEILANGRQGIIAGIHETGATVVLDCHGNVPTVTPDELRAVFEGWTGKPFDRGTKGNRRAKQAQSATNEAKIERRNHVRLHGLTPEELLDDAVRHGTEGQRNDVGFYLALGLYGLGVPKEEARRYLLTYQQAVHAGTHEYTEEEALASLDSAYGYAGRKPVVVSDVDAVLDGLRVATVAGMIKLSPNRQKTWFAVLEIMERCGQLDNVALPTRDVRYAANVSLGTVFNHLSWLAEVGLLRLTQPGDYVRASVYDLTEQAITLGRQVAGSDRLEHLNTTDNCNNNLYNVEVFNFVTIAAIADEYQLLQPEPVFAVRARIVPQMALNDEELQRTVGGATAQRIVALLAVVDEVTSLAELAELVHVSERTVRRRVEDLQRYGIMAQDTLALAPEWRQALADLAPRLTTYGLRELLRCKELIMRIWIHRNSARIERLRNNAESQQIAADAARRAEVELREIGQTLRRFNEVRQRLGGPSVRRSYKPPRSPRPKPAAALYKPGTVSGWATDEQRQRYEERCLLDQLAALRAKAYRADAPASTGAE